MLKKIKNLIAPGIFPLTICFFLITFSIAYKVFNLPSPHELFIIIEQWFNNYGLVLLFIVAFLEGIFIIGMYFPGSLAIALAVLTLGKTPLDLFYIGLISFCAFLTANICNYFLGKYGYYKFLLLIGQKNTVEKMQNMMSKFGNRTFFLTGFFPNFFAITSVSAGISNLNIYKTILYQALSLLFWIMVWTIIASLIIKSIDLQDDNQSYYVLIAVFLWAVFLIIREKLKRSS